MHEAGTFFHHNYLQKDTQHMQPREAAGKYIWVGRLGGDEQQREEPTELVSVRQFLSTTTDPAQQGFAICWV